MKFEEILITLITFKINIKCFLQNFTVFYKLANKNLVTLKKFYDLSRFFEKF